MNTSHDEIRELLSLAAAGALEAAEQRRVDEHTATCAECAAEWVALGAVTGAMRTLPAPRVPVGLATRAMARVRARQGAAVEERVSGAIVVFLALFSWTVMLLPWMISHVTGNALVMWGIRISDPLILLGGSTLLAWVTGGVTVLVLLRSPRREWRMS